MAVCIGKGIDGNLLPECAIIEMDVSVRVHFMDSMIRERRLDKKFPTRRKRDRARSGPSEGLEAATLVVEGVVLAYDAFGRV